MYNCLDMDRELEKAQNDLINFQEEQDNLKVKLDQTNDYSKRREYRVRIKLLKTELIPNVQNKITFLKDKQTLYQELYLNLEDRVIGELALHFHLKGASNSKNLKIIVCEHSKGEILTAIDKIKEDLKKEDERKEIYDKLYHTFTDHDIALFAKKYPIPCKRPDVIEYLVENFTEDEIQRIKIELYEQEEKEAKKEEERQKQEEERQRQEQNEAEESERQARIKEEKLIRAKRILTHGGVKQLQKEFTLDAEEFFDMLSEMDDSEVYSLKTWLKRKYPRRFH